MADVPKPVLLFDGECGLCNRAVRLLLRMDRRERLQFSPLQSAAAQAYLRRRGLPTADFDSLIFVPDWNAPDAHAPRFRTDGVLSALRETGALGRVLSVAGVIPRAWRDLLYRGVARIRYRVFGPYRATALPRPEWARRFL
jgi:predicted DCC family thiol-disulfide oxidoreductase YuxK